MHKKKIQAQSHNSTMGFLQRDMSKTKRRKDKTKGDKNYVHNIRIGGEKNKMVTEIENRK